MLCPREIAVAASAAPAVAAAVAAPPGVGEDISFGVSVMFLHIPDGLPRASPGQK